MRLKMIGAFVALGGMSLASPAMAVPVGGWDDIEVGDVVQVQILNSPKAYRLREVTRNPGPAPTPGVLGGSYLGPLHAGGVDPLADWITYCVDASMPIGSGLQYLVTGFQRVHESNEAQGHSNAAYLYTQYRNGLIDANVNVGGVQGYGRMNGNVYQPGVFPTFGTDAGGDSGPLRPVGLQGAIYHFLNESGSPDDNTLDPSFLNVPGSWSGFGDVWVINLLRWQPDDPSLHLRQEGQPFLVMLDPGTPEVPEPGSLMLLGSGLVGLATAARRRRAGRS